MLHFKIDVLMYPLDRRKLAIHVYSLFNSLWKVAKILKVSHTTVSRWLRNPEKKYTRKVVPNYRNFEGLNISILSIKQIIKDTFKFELIRVAIQSMNLTRKKLD